MRLSKRTEHDDRTITLQWSCGECSFSQATRMAAGPEPVQSISHCAVQIGKRAAG